MKKKIAVAMSGGIDSSIAAYLLIKQGFDVMAINMRVPYILNSRTQDDVRAVCDFLKIPVRFYDFSEIFEEKVVKYFCNEYVNGRTPNPCIVCNKFIKFGELLRMAEGLDAEYIATGHYARIAIDDETKKFVLKKGLDKKKDQSYFLFLLNQFQLSKIIFPLGEYTKDDVRNIAKKINLPVKDKEESQEICFVEDNDYSKFLRDRNVIAKPGNIEDKNGNVVGRHDGICFYTIGQRRGIGAHKEKKYVTKIDAAKNVIVIGGDDDNLKDECIVGDLHWIDQEILKEEIDAFARIRYRHAEAKARIISFDDGTVEVKFCQAQRAVTPGQAMVFFDGDKVLGGGWIK